MRQHKRLLSILLVCCLLIGMFPAAAVETNGGNTHELANDGDLRELLESDGVQDGDTIELQGTVLVNDTNSDSAPWVISKAVTITGGKVDLRAGGILLGADVTFEDITLAFANRVRNAIIANGHTLTLNNVSSDDSANEVHLFCGELTGHAVTAASGNHGKIIIMGSTSLGNIYAGSISSDGAANDWAFPASIVIDSSATGKMGTAYACGALETYVDPDEMLNPDYVMQAPTANAAIFFVTGAVNIALQQGVIPAVDGTMGGMEYTEYADVTYNGNGNLCTLTLANIGSLTVASGNLAPSDSSLTGNVSITEDAILDLTGFGDAVTIADFTGGGDLVLGEDQTLTITGSVTGETSVGIGGIFSGASQGTINNEHIYITAVNSSDSSFVLLPPMNDPNAVFVLGEGGKWTVPATQADTVIVESAVVDAAVTANSGVDYIEIPVSVSYSSNEDYSYFSEVPIEITINGEPVQMVYGEFGYEYIFSGDNGFTLGYFFPGEETETLGLESESVVADGEYVITITIPAEHMADGTALTISTVLTVGSEESGDPDLPENVIASGTCGGEGDGTNLTWVLADDGTLTISGTGKMKDWLNTETTPWADYFEDISAVVIEQGVTTIGYFAFRYFENAVSVSIPNSVESIGNLAFAYWKSLESIEIPESVTCIGGTAFSNCEKLTRIEIPSGVSEIGYNAFGDCYALTNLTVSEDNAYFSSENGVLFDKTKTTLVKYPQGHTQSSYDVPDGVTKIGEEAFAGSKSLVSIGLPDTLTTIGVFAFKSCEALTSIVIPDGVTSIDGSAFSSCYSLESIQIPDSVISIGSSCFSHCRSLTEITLPEGMTLILAHLFFYCDKLTSVTFSKNITCIDNYAFNMCSALTDVFYSGTENTWNSIAIDEYNDELLSATIHYSGTDSVVGIALDQSELTLAVGGTALLSATIDPDYATNKNVTWNSSAESVATVENGMVTAIGVGTATITVMTEDGGFTASCTVTVAEAADPNDLNGDGYHDGDVAVINAIIRNNGLNWTYNDPASWPAFSGQPTYFDNSTGINWSNASAKRIIDLGLSGLVSGDLDISDLTELERLNCEGNSNVTALDISDLEKLIALNCNNTGITELKVSDLVNLVNLQCDNTAVEELDVSGLTNLSTLYCDSTDITELDVTDLTNLMFLKCSNTEIAVLDVSKLTKLIYLICHNTNIAELDVSNLTNLTNLQCGYTKITELDVSKLEKLTTLTCECTGISELDVSNLVNLWYLQCQDTNISVLDVSNLTGLEYLSCYSTGITELDLSDLAELWLLWISDTDITELDISALGKLKSFLCENTQLLSLTVPAGYTVVETSGSDALSYVLPTPVREGYIFTGWFTAPTGGELVEIEDTFTEAATLYSQWTVPAAGVTLDQTSLTLEIDETATLTATVHPDNAENQSVYWISDDTNIVVVNDNGVVTAVSSGTATITVMTEDGAHTATCTVTVTAHTHTEVTISGKDATCTEDGLSDGKKCTTCGETTVEQKVIEAAGHTEEVVSGREPTITQPGLTEGVKCSVCGLMLVEQKEIYLYTVTYDENGGKGTIPSSVTEIEGTVITVAGQGKLTRDGYDFAGWNTAADGSGESYVAGEALTVTSDIVLYAQWIENNILASGYCGDEGDGTNLAWTLTTDGVLTIRGMGAMANYEVGTAPWYVYRAQITRVVLENGVTTIGNYAFADCENLADVSISNSVTWVGSCAFVGSPALGSIMNGTYLACVTAVEEPQYDADGDLSRVGYDIFTVYGLPFTIAVAGNNYRNGEYWLVKCSEDDGAAVADLQPNRINGKQTAISNRPMHTIESVVYMDSANYVLDEAGRDMKMSYTWFLDTEDCVIGSVELMPESVLQSHEWIVAQEIANTEATVKEWIEQQIAAMELNGAEYDVEILTITSATAGDLFNLDGTNGSFSFNVALTKGNDETYAETTVTITSGVITATVYVPAEYTVTYHANGGTGSVASATVIEGESYAIADQGELVREGYEFTGWNTKADGTGESYAVGTSVTISNNLILYAQWKEKKNPAADNIAALETLKSVIESHDWTVDQKTANIKETVQKWVADQIGKMELDGAEFTVEVTAVTSAVAGNLSDQDGTNGNFSFNVTLTKGNDETYAETTVTITSGIIIATVYVPVECTMYYNANGGSGKLPASVKVQQDTVITVAEQGNLKNGNKKFVGWNTQKNGTGVSYQPGERMAVKGDVTLYAQWSTGERTASGTIKCNNDIVLVSVSVRLKGSNGVYTGTVSEVGTGGKKTYYEYSVNAPAGQYTLFVDAVTSDGIEVTCTKQFNLKNHDASHDITIANGHVKAKSDIVVEQDAVQVSADGLDDIVNETIQENNDVTAVEVALVVETVDETSPEAETIRTEINSEELDFVELTVQQNVTWENGETTSENLTELSDTVELSIPFDCEGKSDIKVHRYHGDQVDTLTTTPNEDGEYIELGGDHIVVHAKKFSTYAIGYSNDPGAAEPVVEYTVSFNGNGGSGEMEAIVVEEGTGYTLPECSFTAPDGKKFKAWSVDSVEHEVGDTITVTANITVFSVWEDIAQEPEPEPEPEPDWPVIPPVPNPTPTPDPKPEPEEKGDCDGGETCPVNAFVDTDSGAWYHDGIHYCVENGLMNGLPGGLFDPDGTTTRAQIVTILWRLEGEPVVNYLMQFEDVDAEGWYTEAVRWAAAEGIVNGYSAEKFAPDDAITREQMAAMLYRYMQYKGGGFTGTWMFLLDYPDRAEVSEWAYEAICWMTMNGIISGVPDGDGVKLDPEGNATRVQVATMLMRFCEMIKED